MGKGKGGKNGFHGVFILFISSSISQTGGRLKKNMRKEGKKSGNRSTVSDNVLLDRCYRFSQRGWVLREGREREEGEKGKKRKKRGERHVEGACVAH